MTYLAWIAVAVTAGGVLVAAIPRRMLWGAMLAWVLSPMVVYFAIIGWELLTRPDASYPAGTALYGLMLISPIIVPSWLALCLVGFGVGSGIRRLLRPPSSWPLVSYQTPVAAATVPIAVFAAPAPNLAENACRTAARRPQVVADHVMSPDRTICVEYDRVEWSSNNWVNSPRLSDIPRGRIVLDLWGDDWDATIAFPAPRKICLDLRRYHRGGGIVVEINLEAYTYRMISGNCLHQAGSSGSLAGLPDALHTWSQRVAEKAATQRRGTVGRPNVWAAWRSALVILALSLAAIGVASYLSLHYGTYGRPAPTPLATVPPMK